MEGHRESQSLRQRDLILITVLIPMLLSAMIIGGILYVIGRLGDWRWFTWFALSPLIYMAWLILFLGICARNSYRLGSRNPKPRFVKSQRGAGRALSPPGTRTVIICMFRFAFITSLPLVRTLERAHLFRNLVWRSYSPSVHVAKTAMVWGSILDPDLTEIGEGAVIGWSAEIHAHTFTSRPDGSYVYVSAPIRIGARATIGGTAYVALGSVIGEGAVVEPKSYVAPFSTIAPGERWGGVPARCLQKRDHEQQRDEERIERSTEQSVKFDKVVLEQARRLVAFALGLKASELPQELSADSSGAWDSLGQLAIATALFDSYGVAIGNERVFQLRTLEDVANAIVTLTVTPNSGGVSNPEEAPAISAEKPVPQPGAFRLPVDIEMLPLCDPAEATRALTERFMDRPAAEPLRVVIASSFTAQPLAITLKVWGRAFGLELDCEIAGFNQIATTLLAADGPFAGNATGVNVVLVGPTDRVFDSAEQASRAIGEPFLMPSKCRNPGRLRERKCWLALCLHSSPRSQPLTGTSMNRYAIGGAHVWKACRAYSYSTSRRWSKGSALQRPATVRARFCLACRTHPNCTRLWGSRLCGGYSRPGAARPKLSPWTATILFGVASWVKSDLPELS